MPNKNIKNNLILKQTDSPGYLKLKTKSYSMDREGITLTHYKIANCSNFGEIDEGCMGNHSIELNQMHYGSAIEIPFITKLRTACNEQGESLSRAYFFNSFNKNPPLSIFIIVKRPWKEIITKKEKLYAVTGYVRSPDNKVTLETKPILEKILETEAKNSINF